MNKYYTQQFEQMLIKECKIAFSMAQACANLKMHFNTFKKHAMRLNVYNTNQSGKGMKKLMPKIPIQDILEGLHPEYQTNKLRERLIQEKVFDRRCSICKLSIWNNQSIPLELHHSNGNRFDHRLINLLLLCPNCHAQTSTYRGKNVAN